jgi:hypothetical protein
MGCNAPNFKFLLAQYYYYNNIKITFSPMNYQKMRDAPTNYQLNQNRAFNYQRQPFFPLPSVKWVKTNGQWVTWPSHAVLPSFSYWQNGGKWLSLIVECSILVELVVHWDIAYFLVVHGGKGNYPKNLSNKLT